MVECNGKSCQLTLQWSDPQLPFVFLSKKFTFSNDDTVWIAKQTVLLEFSSLNLVDPLNYGFYMPPLKGKSGKFLDEERPLRDYPAESYGDHLEFRYKKRIYRGLHMEEKKLSKYQSKSYQKKFFEFLVTGNEEKAKKLLEKGLDPNFQSEATGETPLTTMVQLPNSSDTCMMLVTYGAHLDYRAANGMTVMHKAVLSGRDENIAFLLDFGASPNYKDAKGLTPLYHGILEGVPEHCCELLLNERSVIGSSDIQGCSEIHVACRNGLDRHLEHLIFYGANLNSRTDTGNTPLHICAIGNQENCARILLFRGADPNLVNHGNQTPHDIAVLSGNSELVAVFSDFDLSQVTPFLEKPVYSRRRRAPGSRPNSSSPSPKIIINRPNPEHGEIPRSVTVANRGDLDIARGSNEEMLLRTMRKTNNNNMTVETESDKKRQDSEDSGSDCSDSDDDTTNKEKRINRRTFSTGAMGKKAPAPIKAGLGTKAQVKSRLYQSIPGRQFIAVVDYHPRAPGELAMERGDAVEVLYIGDQGFWEGRIKERTGWFPSSCLQELKKTTKKEKNRTWFGKKSNQKEVVEKCVKPDKPDARVVNLKKSERGFGFQLRGANSHLAHIEFTPSIQFPALQYIGEVDKGGVAEKVGLKAGDFVIEVNGENVAKATHGHVVSLVANSGKSLSLKVVTVAPEKALSSDVADGGQNLQAKFAQSQPSTISAGTASNAKKIAPPPMTRSQYSSLTVGNLHSSAALPESQMAPSVDTVMTIDKKAQRKRSVKSMWSETALKLHSDPVKTEEISKGVVRRSRALSVNAPKEQEGEVRVPSNPSSISSLSSSSSPNINGSVPFPVPLTRSHSQSSDQNSGDLKASESQNRPAAPPNYEVTLENMRRIGRKPSFQRSDSEKRATLTVESAADARSRTSSTSSDTFPPPPIPDPPSYLPPPPPVDQQPHIIRSMSLPAKPEATSVGIGPHTSSEQAGQNSASSDEEESSSDFAKQLRQVAAARKKRTTTSKLSIDESLNLRKKEQSLHVIKENESTKTFSGKNMPKSSSSDALLNHKDGKVSDHHNLYAASSTSSLDTQTSKDSGIDVSDIMNQAPGEQPPDLASALANAVAKRAEKIARKEPFEQNNNVKYEKQVKQEFIGVKLKPTHTVTGPSTNVKNQLVGTPPPVRPKPQAKLPSGNVVDETLKDNAIVQHQPPQAQTELNSESVIRNEVVTPPPMFTSETNEGPDVDNGSSTTDTLPSPPTEFLSEMRCDAEKSQQIIGSVDPPPPYSPPRAKNDLPVSISSKPFPEWTADEVGQWLDYINMGQYKESFVDNDIQGSHLSDLTKDDLSELGIKKLGHRLTIDDAIGKLRSQLQYTEV